MQVSWKNNHGKDVQLSCFDHQGAIHMLSSDVAITNWISHYAVTVTNTKLHLDYKGHCALPTGLRHNVTAPPQFMVLFFWHSDS